MVGPCNLILILYNEPNAEEVYAFILCVACCAFVICVLVCLSAKLINEKRRGGDLMHSLHQSGGREIYPTIGIAKKCQTSM